MVTDTCSTPAGIAVTVRYFAAACAAAGVESETLTVAPDTTVADLINGIAGRNPRLSTVLDRCSFLCDGMAVRDRTTPLRAGETLDVLPPFAGG